jgi:hypothetical protein
MVTIHVTSNESWYVIERLVRLNELISVRYERSFGHFIGRTHHRSAHVKKSAKKASVESCSGNSDLVRAVFEERGSGKALFDVASDSDWVVEQMSRNRWRNGGLSVDSELEGTASGFGELDMVSADRSRNGIPVEWSNRNIDNPRCRVGEA